jgi:hypothetical protein
MSRSRRTPAVSAFDDLKARLRAPRLALVQDAQHSREAAHQLAVAARDVRVALRLLRWRQRRLARELEDLGHD